MKLASVTRPASTMSLATSPMRRTFSSRSSALKPRLQLSPWRTLSPSSSVVRMPRAASACSSVHATVDLPEPLRPVNHSTQPRWFSRRSLTSRDTAPSCQVMLSQRRSTPAVATPARCTRAAPRPAAAGGSSCGCAIIAGRAQGAGRSRPDRRAMRTPGSRDTCAARRAARQLTRGSPPSRGRLGRRANPYSKVHRDSRRIVGASSTQQSGSMALRRAEAARRAPDRGSTGAGLSSGRAPFRETFGPHVPVFRLPASEIRQGSAPLLYEPSASRAAAGRTGSSWGRWACSAC